MDKRYRDIKVLPCGDIGFTYTPYMANVVKFDFLLCISFLLTGIILCSYSYIYNSSFLLLLIIPICLFVYNYKTSNKDKENETVEANAIEYILNDSKLKEIVKKLSDKDVEVLYRKYVISPTISFGHYERYYYVAFSNDKILRFKVVPRKGRDNDGWNLTIRINPEECKYSECAHYVIPYSKRVQKKISLDTPIIAIGFLFSIFLVLSSCFILPFIYFRKTTLIVTWGWLGIISILSLIAKWVNFPNWLYIIARFPGQIINLWIKLLATFAAPLLGLFIITVLGGFFATIVYLTTIYLFTDQIYWKLDLAVFIGVSTMSISSVHFTGMSRWVMERCGAFGVRETKTLELPMLGLAEYFLQKENINAIIYLSYFVFLFYLSLRMFALPPQDSPIWEVSVDSALIKAFVVHIAATNMFAKINDRKIKIPKVHDYMKKILGLR